FEEPDENMRITTISKLITSLPERNYETLNAFISHLHSLIASTDADDDYITTLAQIYGYILLYPDPPKSEKDEENVEIVYLNDRHPYRLVKDLIIHHDKIFKSQNTTSNIIAEVMRRSESRESIYSARSSRSNRSNTRDSSFRDSVTTNSITNSMMIVEEEDKESEINEEYEIPVDDRISEVVDVTRSRGDSLNYSAEHSAILRDKLSRLSSSESIEFSRPFTPQSPIFRPIGPRPNPSKEDNNSGTSSPKEGYNVANSLNRRRGIRRYSRIASPSGKSRDQSSSSEREPIKPQPIDDDENGSDSSSNLSSPESPALRFNTRSHSP
ncbi:12811_t:CDS:2, partial [Dentiscutata erythropus]